MKKQIYLFFTLLIFIFLALTVKALPNPSAVYCKELGYKYEIVETPLGQQGICVMPNQERCEAWDFFKGSCGKNFSYCARQGYDIETIDGIAVCVVRNGSEIKKVPITELIDLKSSSCSIEEQEKRERKRLETLQTIANYFKNRVWRKNSNENL